MITLTHCSLSHSLIHYFIVFTSLLFHGFLSVSTSSQRQVASGAKCLSLRLDPRIYTIHSVRTSVLFPLHVHPVGTSMERPMEMVNNFMHFADWKENVTVFVSFCFQLEIECMLSFGMERLGEAGFGFCILSYRGQRAKLEDYRFHGDS